MSRTLSDDFDEDDSPGGGPSLDLEKGRPTGAGGMASSSTGYDSGGIDFDDDDDGPARGALELDLPQGSATALRSAAPGPPPPAGGRSAPPGGPAVPDLAFGPPPSSRSSGAHPAAAPPPSSSQSSIPSVVPSSQRSLAPHDGGGHSQAPASGGGGHPAASLAPAPAPPARPTAAAVIAKYPAAPAKVWQAPKYAIQILLRQFELRSELESLRRRRSPDVPLYEAALQAYDPKTFRLGMTLNAAILAIATFVFFLPVILRFMRAD